MNSSRQSSQPNLYEADTDSGSEEDSQSLRQPDNTYHITTQNISGQSSFSNTYNADTDSEDDSSPSIRQLHEASSERVLRSASSLDTQDVRHEDSLEAPPAASRYVEC